jgi:hypothetical protein
MKGKEGTITINKNKGDKPSSVSKNMANYFEKSHEPPFSK